MAQPTNNNKKLPLIIGFLVLLLLGGGIGLWFALRKKEPLDSTAAAPSDDAEQGRTDFTNTLSDNEQIVTTVTDVTQSGVFTPPVDDTPAIYLYSPEAQQLITEMAKEIAKSDTVIGKLRARIDTGEVFTDNTLFTANAQSGIDETFGGFTNVTAGNPNTYPIYSTFEANGKAIYDELKRLVNTDFKTLGLSNLRAGGEPEYISTLDLNLYYGKRGMHTHTADQIWWYQADRDGLDRFKKINGHGVSDRRLLEKTQGRESFPAGTVHKIAAKWVAEIERLDVEVKKEAQIRLEDKGWEFLLTDPNGGSSSTKGGKFNT